MSSREGLDTQSELGVRKTFTQHTPRGELRPDDIVAMESFKQQRKNKIAEADSSATLRTQPTTKLVHKVPPVYLPKKWNANPSFKAPGSRES